MIKTISEKKVSLYWRDDLMPRQFLGCEAENEMYLLKYIGYSASAFEREDILLQACLLWIFNPLIFFLLIWCVEKQEFLVLPPDFHHHYSSNRLS